MVRREPVALRHRKPRRGIRVRAHIARALEWQSPTGGVERAEALTRVVGPYGCLMISPHQIEPGQKVRLTKHDNQQVVIGSVVWQGKKRPEGWEIGIELECPTMDFWVMDPQLPPAEERRRSQRALLRYRVFLNYQVQHHTMRVPARTVSINDHGALLVCARAFPTGTQLEIENPFTRLKRVCLVQRAPKEVDDGFQLALRFDSPDLEFWQVTFPPPA